MNFFYVNILLFHFLIKTYSLSIPNIFKWLSSKRVSNKIIESSVVNEPTPFEKYSMSWYVVGESNTIKKNKPFKVTVWSKDYVIWKSSDNKYHALEDVCSHKGSSLSIGSINNNHITCPYHGYEFDSNGNLTVVPGICFHPSPLHTIPRFSVVEKYGWIYLNIYQIPWFTTDFQLTELNKNIFLEPETVDKTMSTIFVNTVFNTYARIVSENSLDIMHIAYVHTFGNRDKPAPSYEDPPKQLTPYHWKTSYIYESGEHSMISKVFNVKKIEIENEFALPHTTIARIKFGKGMVNTIVTSACPINEKETKLFVKNYRNFFSSNVFDNMFYNMMIDTLNQDKAVIESIKYKDMDGKFNMKFDKLQNTYKTLYKKYLHNS